MPRRRRTSDSTPNPWTGPGLFRQGVVRAGLVANAYRPASGMFTMAPSFFSSWLTTEGAPALLGLWKVRTAVELLRRRRSGEPLGVADVAGLALTAGASIGALRTHP